MLGEEFYRQVFEATAEGLVVQDREGRITDSNAAAEQILGLTREQLHGLTSMDPRWRAVNEWGEPISGEDHPAMITLRTGSPVRGFLMQVDRPDGSVVWLKINSQPLKDENAAMIGVVVSFADVTSLRQIQDRLLQSEEATRATVENSLDAVIAVNQRGRVLEWNRSAEKLLGWQRGEVLSRQIDHLILGDRNRALWRRELHRIQQNRGGRLLENVYQVDVIDRQGQAIPVEAVVTLSSSQGHARITAFLRDIRDRRRAEAMAEEARSEAEMHRERLELALEGGKLSCWDWNPTAGTVRFDSRWAFQVGERLEDLGDQTEAWSNRLHPDDIDDVMQRLTPVLAGEQDHYQATFRLLHRNGSWVWILANGRVVERDNQGRPIRMVGTQLDVSEQKARELELAKLRDQADSANQAKSEFLANMSHEIRTPLTAILGYTDLLEHDEQLASCPLRRGEVITTMRRAGEHLLRIINDVLDLSKIESGRFQVDRVSMQFGDVLQDVEALMSSRAKEKQLDFGVALETPVPKVLHSDPTRLRQILINLVGNAIKFTDRGGVRVRVRVQTPFGTELGVMENAPGHQLIIDVEDTGPGLSSKQAELLFRPFEQGDNSVTRKYGGSGLGLVISRRLARLMGGDVELTHSEVGRGTCFRLTLAFDAAVLSHGLICDLKPTDNSPAKPIASQTKLRGRILLAEDGPDNQRLLSAILTRAGAELEMVENGRLALERFSASRTGGPPFDLILTDVQMPEMDGLTLTRTLRDMGERIPIIALTAHAMAEDRQRCLDAGCDDYTTKPIQIHELLDTCARWLAEHQ